MQLGCTSQIGSIGLLNIYSFFPLERVECHVLLSLLHAAHARALQDFISFSESIIYEFYQVADQADELVENTARITVNHDNTSGFKLQVKNNSLTRGVHLWNSPSHSFPRQSSDTAVAQGTA